MQCDNNIIYRHPKKLESEANNSVSNKIIPTDKHATSSTPLGHLPVPKSIIICINIFFINLKFGFFYSRFTKECCSA